MADNLKGIPFNTEDEGVDYPSIARKLVYQAVKTRLSTSSLSEMIEGFAESDVYLVWFAYVLGGWKALLSTSVPDGRYYEVTHNHVKKETYLDTYVKVENKMVDV